MPHGSSLSWIRCSTPSSMTATGWPKSSRDAARSRIAPGSRRSACRYAVAPSGVLRSRACACSRTIGLESLGARTRRDTDSRPYAGERASACGAYWHTRAAWATMPGWLVMTARPVVAAAGLYTPGRGQALEDARMGVPCRPRCYPGRRRGRALGRSAPAAGPGRVGRRCWLRAGGVGPWHGSADQCRGAQKLPAAAKGPVAQARHRGPGYRRDGNTPAPPAIAVLDRADLASPVAWMVIGVPWRLRHPRRLTVLAIAAEAPNVVFGVLRAARAVQRRRPRIAAG